MKHVKPEFDYIALGPKKRPVEALVVLLHGYGVNAKFMEKMAEEVLRQVPGALVVAPHAPSKMDLPPAGEREGLVVGPPDEAENPPGDIAADSQLEWFAITDTVPEMHRDMLDVAEKMNRFIDRLRDENGLSDSNIAIMGFSQGGAVAVYTACSRENELACVVAHSTVIMDTAGFTANPPTLVIYGTADQSFSQEDFLRHTVIPLQKYLKDIEVRKIQGLNHRTSSESRKMAAAYIGKKLGAPGP